MLQGFNRRHFLLAGACAPLAGCGIWPDASFNYRLKLSARVGDQTYTGASVIHIQYYDLGSFVSLDGSGEGQYHITGDAVTVDMGQHGLLFGLLRNTGGAEGFSARNPHNVLDKHLPQMPPATRKEWLAALQSLPGEYPFPNDDPEYHPRPALARFTDLRKPETVDAFPAEDFARIYGPDASIAASLAITKAPVTHGIEQTLPWLRTIKLDSLGGDPHSRYDSPSGPDARAMGSEHFMLRET